MHVFLSAGLFEFDEAAQEKRPRGSVQHDHQTQTREGDDEQRFSANGHQKHPFSFPATGRSPCSHDLGVVAWRRQIRSEEHRHVELIHHGVELIERLIARRVLRHPVILDVAEIEVVERDAAHVECGGRALEYLPAVRQEGVGHFRADGVIVLSGEILVAPLEAVLVGVLKQVAVEIRMVLLVVAEPAFQDPDIADRMGVVKLEGIAVVLVEQNVRRALASSARYYCMQKGRVVLEGRSDTADYTKVSAAYFGI